MLQIRRGLEKDGVLNGAGNTVWHETNIKQILKSAFLVEKMNYNTHMLHLAILNGHFCRAKRTRAEPADSFLTALGYPPPGLPAVSRMRSTSLVLDTSGKPGTITSQAD